MQIYGRDHIGVRPTEEKGSSLFGKKTSEKEESRVISCQNQSRTLNAVI